MKTTRKFIWCPLAFACFWLLPLAQAVVPPPDGGYPGGNTAEGANALFSLTTGTYNTAVGLDALYSDTVGNRNTAVGLNALRRNTSGNQNTAVGAEALRFNVASGNTAIGDSALLHNTGGLGNAAVGANALLNNTTGQGNVAVGQGAMRSNTEGFLNAAIGYQALRGNTVGTWNTATGVSALWSNTNGNGNTADGYQALYSNTTGFLNTATGFQALSSNTMGTDNTAIGEYALQNNSTGDYNIALGWYAGSNIITGRSNIDIGNSGVSDESATIRIGNDQLQSATFIAAIHGVNVIGGTTVYINSLGHLGTVASSERFKKDIAAMDKTSEAILSLRPVTFHYKTDTKATPQFGLIAEEVANLNPDLVVPDKDGKPYTVRYDAVNAMLLNEFLKAHRKIEEQQATIAQLKSTIAQQMEAVTARLKEQALLIQKVNDKVELSKAAPRTVANDQ